MSTQARRRQARDDGDSGRDDQGSDEEMGRSGGQDYSRDGAMAKKLVRYALSCEYSRTPIRREGIKERVLGNEGRAFRRVFELAQKQLRSSWGMELQELPVREKLTLQEKRQALKSNSQPKAGSGVYIVTTSLHQRFKSPSIIPPSKTPSQETEAAYAGFYSMVVSIIMLSGGEISNQRLRRLLARLNADRNVVNDTTDNMLARMQKQGYVIRKVEKISVGDEEQVSWLVGPRGREEVGADGVASMVRTVFGGSTPELEKQIAASLGTSQQEPLGDGDDDDDDDGDDDMDLGGGLDGVRASRYANGTAPAESSNRNRRRTRGG